MGTFAGEVGTGVEKVKENHSLETQAGADGAKSPPEAPGEDHEPDYRCNGNPDSSAHENGDGDLPSFSIKRLRRLPLRVTSDQQPSPLSPRADPTAKSHAVDGNRSEPGSAIAPQAQQVEQQKILPGPRAVDAAAPSVETPQQEQESFSNTSPNKVVEFPHPGLRNGEVGSREFEQENGKHAVEGAEVRNSGGYASGLPSPGMSSKQIGNEDSVTAPEHALDSSNTPIGKSGNTLTQSYESHIPSPNSDVEHAALEHGSEHGLQVDDPLRENVSSEISDPPSSSPGLESVADKEKIQDGASTLVVEDPNREENGKVAEDMSSMVSTSPGVVQILPPVMGSRFESPGETTDEETDSPRSSEGFAYPDSDAMALPYSGQIMYPSRFSNAQTSNGPSLLQYSGSMSLRSDSSTTSNRSFAFPILAPPEWNSSPVRMAKAHPRRKNRFDGCCFFRLSRMRNKY